MPGRPSIPALPRPRSMSRARVTCGTILLASLASAACDGVDREGAAADAPRTVTTDSAIRAGGERTVDSVRVASAGADLIIENLGGRPIYYALFPRETLRHIEWAPTIDDGAVVVEPGDHVRIALASVLRGTANEAIVIAWWRAETRDGTRVPSSVTFVEVRPNGS